MKKTINIAVVGLGQVGIYLLNELNTKKKDINLKTGKIIKNNSYDLYPKTTFHKILQKSEIVIRVSLGTTGLSESVWTTDLSYDYVKINAEYRS